MCHKVFERKCRCPYCNTVIHMSGDKYNALMDYFEKELLQNDEFMDLIKEIIKKRHYEYEKFSNIQRNWFRNFWKNIPCKLEI